MSEGFVFEVSGAAALREVLEIATGGETILLAEGHYGYLNLSRDFPDTVTIKAAPEARVTFGGFKLDGANNVAFD
ncbi:MAG: hypothetical protein AAFY03_06075, partial [Pseudomonadota bacterium]